MSSALRRRTYRAEWFRRARDNAGALHRLDQELRGGPPPAVPDGGPTIEQLARDLRRLNRQRRGGPTTHSERWLAAVDSAYDQRLMLVCQAFGLAGHLDKLDGVDREAERIRLVALLAECGLFAG